MTVVHWFYDQFEWLKGFFSEGRFDEDGHHHLKASSKRLALLAIVFTFIYSYIRIAWVKQDLLDIPAQWAITLPILLGIAVVGNVVQNGKNKAASTIEDPTK